MPNILTMDRNEIVEKVESILVEILKHNRFEMQDNLSVSEVEGWDSLTHMRIITHIERVFNFKFKLRELKKLVTVGTMIDLIQSKLDD